MTVVPPGPDQPNPQPQNPYIQAQPVYLVAQPKGLSVTSLVLGLVSIFFGFTFFVPLTGLILGILGVRREPAGRGMAIAGSVLSGIMLLGWVIVAGFFVLFWLGLAGATGAAVLNSPSQ
ncbi:DUF4190 domain-containing protein [Galbitalea soli]|uniref:DUF4190 domain-containing protein n=1 Tax=Galbitalea soli TaxID=1268042 RepID=A0A7C9TPL1_9MICO|nr:DUF4190 domain-containing protein [Galbitalea soli]NEM90837.1 DUF4190 domain-containing protein [Galbitalea soli]NYJ31557.1 hypothetical protein [Galbitalea soli]